MKCAVAEEVGDEDPEEFFIGGFIVCDLSGGGVVFEEVVPAVEGDEGVVGAGGFEEAVGAAEPEKFSKTVFHLEICFGFCEEG